MTVTISWAPTPTTQTHVTLGSGVWVGKAGYIATCQHVINGRSGPFWIGLTHEPLAFGSTPTIAVGNVVSYAADLLYSDVDTDVAILKSHITPEQANREAVTTTMLAGPLTNPPISARVASISNRFPEPGETLLLAGYPLDGAALILQTGTATGLFSQHITDHSPVPSTQRLRIMLSLVSNPGNSGGPVFDADGKVIGLLQGNLLSYVSSDDLGVAYCAWQHLDANGQPTRNPSGQPQLQPGPCMQNSGISYAVPAKFIADLAKSKNINLD
jgi:S1-C subfamily serine protease